MSGAPPSAHAEVVIDLGAIRHNVTRLREIVSEGVDEPPLVMVVVKADAYGHGMVRVARAARAAGADWIGVATPDEALALRRSGDDGPLLCWLATPGRDYTALLDDGIDVTVSSLAQLEEVLRAARETSAVARVQIKVDTGLTRGGAPREEWLDLMSAARTAEQQGLARVTGLWSHLAASDEPDHAANSLQEEEFAAACALAKDTGLTPELRHLANSAAAILRPSSRHDLVRLGIAVYGLSPAPQVASSAQLGLVPAMTVRTRAALAKNVAAGTGVSYGHIFVAPEPMRVALVPLGYGDGVPRHASNRAEVMVGGRRGRVLGRVCMDQFTVAAPDVTAGDAVVLFGPGDDGEPTAQEWADWCGTISYEIVTRMRGRQTRVWVDPSAPSDRRDVDL